MSSTLVQLGRVLLEAPYEYEPYGWSGRGVVAEEEERRRRERGGGSRGRRHNTKEKDRRDMRRADDTACLTKHSYKRGRTGEPRLLTTTRRFPSRHFFLLLNQR